MWRAFAVVALASLILTGCGGTSDVPPTSGAMNSVLSSHPTTATENTGSTGPEVLVSGWAPPPVPIPKDPEYREKLGPYADLLLRGGLTPYGSEEHVLYIVSCIESAGFSVTLDPSGPAIEAAPGAQVDQFRQVQAACEQPAIDSGLVAAPTYASKEFLAAQYQAMLITYQCLIDRGYPTSEPPSEQAYVDRAVSWHPYEVLSGPDHEAAEQVCPWDLTTLFEQMAAAGQTP